MTSIYDIYIWHLYMTSIYDIYIWHLYIYYIYLYMTSIYDIHIWHLYMASIYMTSIYIYIIYIYIWHLYMTSIYDIHIWHIYFNPPKNCTTCNFPCTAVLLVKIGCPRDIAHGDSRTGPTLSTDRPNLPAGRRCLRRSGKAWHPITHGGGWAGSTDGYEQQWIEITVTQH